MKNQNWLTIKFEEMIGLETPDNRHRRWSQIDPSSTCGIKNRDYED